jgi:hypothetical protein
MEILDGRQYMARNQNKNQQQPGRQQPGRSDQSDLGESRISSSSFDDETSGVRKAGDLYGSDMDRDDRELREQRANNPKPNEDH